MRWIPKQVNLLPEMPEYKQIERPIKDVLKDGYIRIAFARLMAKLQFRRYVKQKHPADGAAIFSFVSKNLSPILPDINPEKEYDLAVSYLAPHDYVLRHVRAKKRWLGSTLIIQKLMSMWTLTYLSGRDMTQSSRYHLSSVGHS